MDIHDRIRSCVPRASAAEIARWVEGGIAYADRLDKLPAREREAVAALFALYGFASSNHERQAYRRAINSLCKPFYPAVGVDDAPRA